MYPELVIPAMFTEREVDAIKPSIENAAKAVFSECGFSISYRIGCLLDNPRACLRADAIAKRNVEFLCFDLNSLTEHTYGVSKSDMSRYIVSIYLKDSC